MIDNNNNLKILSEISRNTDGYNWKDLNCFYKPIAIILSYFDKSYFNDFLLLLGFCILYNNKNSVKFINDKSEFVCFYDANLREILNVDMETVLCEDKEDFIDNIILRIDNSNPVLVPIDLFEIYYDDKYKRMHAPHYIIIKGYDKERRIFYILDTLHISSGERASYVDYKITFDMLWNAYTKGMFWTFCEGTQLKSHMELLAIYRDMVRHIIENNKPCIDMEIYKQESLRKFDLENYTNKCNMRRVYYDVIIRFLEELRVQQEYIESVTALSEEVTDTWESIRSKIVYKICKREPIIQDSQAEAAALREIELHKTIYELLSESMNNNKLEQKPYNIKNGHKAHIEVENSRVLIEHDENQISNLWLSQDEAPQVLYDMSGAEEVFFEAELEILRQDNLDNQNSSYQSGLIAKLQNGTRYLFGLEQGQYIGVISPEANLEEQTEYYENTITIQIHKNQRGISFKYKSQNQWMELYFIGINDCTELKSIGLFSKTWHTIKHKVCFNNIKHWKK